MATADRSLPPKNAVAAEFTLRKEIANAHTEVASPQTGCAAGRSIALLFLPGLAQSRMTVRHDVHHDDCTFWYMQGETKTKT
jgi:hypothetical protein